MIHAQFSARDRGDSLRKTHCRFRLGSCRHSDLQRSLDKPRRG